MRPVLFGALSGLLLILAYQPFGIPLMSVPALVPLSYGLALAKNRPEATAVGMAWALVFFGIELLWIPSALADVTRLGTVAYLGILGILMLLGGLVGVGTWRLCRSGLAPPLAFAVAFVGVEWIRAHFGPLAFPWLGLGTAFGPTPMLMAPVAWAGERGLAFVAAGLSGLIALALNRAVTVGRTAPRSGGVGGWGMTVVVAAWAVGCLALRGAEAHAVEEGRTISLAVMTTAFGPRGVLGIEDRLLSVEAQLGRWLEADSVPVEAVLLPEGTLPLPLEQRPDLIERLANLSGRIDAPLVVGAYGATNGDDPSQPAKIFNSTFLVGPEGIQGRSDKRHRVPIVESGFAKGRPTTLSEGGLSDASGEPGLQLGPFVCFESLFTDVARELTRNGANILVNPTSEAWFQHGGGWAATQHGEHLRSRALESGRWVVRIANEGASLVLDPTGRVQWRSEEPGVTRVTVRSRTTPTLYTRLGDVVGLFSGLAVGLVLLAGVRATGSSRSVERTTTGAIFRPE